MANGLRQAVRQACRRDEAQCVAALLAELATVPGDPAAVDALARQLVGAVRRQAGKAGGVAHLMHEFSLSSQEGIALMCLAEALLRIPDKATVDRLIRDKIGHGDWESHLGGSASLFVNAATWGLLLTGKLVAGHSHGALGQALNRLLARGGEPLIRRSIDFAMRLLGQQFVMGETIDAALARSRADRERGYRHSFDMLGEAALTAADAEAYGLAYAQAIHAIGRAGGGQGVEAGPGISIKLSALHPRYTRSQRTRVMAELLPRLQSLAGLAKQYDIGLNIDAEESERLDLSLDLLAALAGDPQLAGWDGLGFVVQAYQKRAPFVIDWLVDLARRSGRRLMLRLVKGAYWDSEIKRAQVDGLADYPVFTRKAHTDLNYLACANRLLAAGDAVYPQFATHNAQTLAALYDMARARGVEAYEFQCLHGMGEALYAEVVGAQQLGRPCRIYAPVGSHATLLPYLVRRLLENGANSSFVNRLLDETVSVDELVADPVSEAQRSGGGRHPRIVLPGELYGAGRRNSSGVDLADEATIAGLDEQLGALAGRVWQAGPLVAGLVDGGGPALPVVNPARSDELVGRVIEADAAAVDRALAVAVAFAEEWFCTAPGQRAAALLRAADLFEAQRPQLFSLLIREAGKTWPNAVAEVREAVDFCRYYGRQLMNGHFPDAAEPGPVACISPWNFPLAIFIGQISAALAVGSPVLAKPAEQTPLIAALAVDLLHQAGIPPAALQLLPGPGETVGAALTADRRVRGVVFTGSGEVAERINRSIAGRAEVRLIAETGGQNALIVDSSALPEQVVRDVLVAGFDSAGQRCSALRVLCLQQEIADPVLLMLRDAMRELAIGDPARLATDVGPLIDAEAQAAVLGHIERMRATGHAVFQPPLPDACAEGDSVGYFVPPTLIEIDAISDVDHEVFGPVVHVLRFAGGRLDELVDAINGTGYGLTLGVHSRIDETVQRVIGRARVGNIYVNRHQVGAVVGVQPFGGEGLSGTGPKAGGPLYLLCLAGSAQVGPAELGAPPVDEPVDAPLPVRRLAVWAAASGRAALAELCNRSAALSLRHVRLALPGPTGERNTLGFVPRGRLLCVADDEDGLLGQFAAALATDNAIAAVDTLLSRKLLAALPPELAGRIELRAADDYAGLAGVLLAGDAGLAGVPRAGRSGLAGVMHAGEGGRAAELRQRLAAQPGPLLPLWPAAAGSLPYPLYRLLVERVVSVDTTAAGGNTSLMTLGA